MTTTKPAAGDPDAADRTDTGFADTGFADTGFADTDFADTDFEIPDDTSEASPLVGAVGTLWFFALGCGMAYFAINNYFGLGSLTSATVWGPMAGALAMFFAAGMVAKTVTWRASTVPEDAPWQLRPAWQSPTIEEGLYFRSTSPWLAAVFAVGGWGAGGIGFYYNYWLPEDPSSSALLILIFPIAFSLPGMSFLRRARHRRKYGTSTLRMDTMPGRLGQTLRMRVRTGVSTSAMQSDTFQVTLTCYHRRKSGRNASFRALWEAESEADGEAAPSSRAEPPVGGSAGGSVEIPVSFDLSAGAPRSTPEKKSQRIAWILEVTAETSGLDYQSYFEIPVFEPTAPAAAEPSAQKSSVQESTASDPSSAPSPSSPEGPEPSVTDPETVSDDAVPNDAVSDDTFSEDVFSEDDLSREASSRDASSDEPAGEEDTVRCDNCYSAVDASASTCSACGADLDSGWFS